MRKAILLNMLLVLLFSAVIQAETANKNESNKPKFHIGVTLGTNGGFGGEIHGMVSNLTQNTPLNLRFVIGYSSLKPGIAAEARQVFINDATNGVPEENGYLYDYKFDVIFPVKLFSFEESFLFVGPRYTKFTANFVYVGGNEDFYIRSQQWGFGTGLETNFAINQKFNLVVTSGVDYMQESVLEGHDTSYSPDGTTGNERNTYTYEDADNAINQPKFELRLMIGFTYGL